MGQALFSSGKGPGPFLRRGGAVVAKATSAGCTRFTADFPLGLPLQPRGDEVVPLDISVSFTDLPGLGQAITRAISRQPIAFELEGTVGVAAGRFGEPTFGPMTILRGELR